MANAEHLKLVYRGPEFWNGWWGEAPETGADLSGADLRGLNLSEISLYRANLKQADLSGSHLASACFAHADLSFAKLHDCFLSGADFTCANLFYSDLSQSVCDNVALYGALLVSTNLEGATLNGAHVFGSSAWDLRLAGAVQRDIVITPAALDSPVITVDNLEIAQFIYLLINNSKLRDAIDTITSKAVLILGRFTPQRKAVLDSLRNALRSRNYLPLLFDFERPKNRDFTETICVLAGLSRFVIADLTDPRSIPQELMAIIPRLLSVPVRPVLLGEETAWTMFADLARYPQVIPPLHYTDDRMLLSCLESQVIIPAERKALALAGK